MRAINGVPVLWQDRLRKLRRRQLPIKASLVDVGQKPLLQLVAEINVITARYNQTLSVPIADIEYVAGLVEQVYDFADSEEEVKLLDKILSYCDKVETDTENVWYKVVNALLTYDNLYKYVLKAKKPRRIYATPSLKQRSTSPSPPDDEFYGVKDLPMFGGGSQQRPQNKLSLAQLNAAFNKLYKAVSKANGGWVSKNPLFLGLSNREIAALVEEGLAVVRGGAITLTREGWERRQYFKY